MKLMHEIYGTWKMETIFILLLFQVHQQSHLSQAILFLMLDAVVASEPRISLHPTILDRPETSHQQRGELDSEVLQIPMRQRPNPLLDVHRHVLVMVFLVAQGTEKIQHFGAVVLALLAECVEEHSVELALPIFIFAADDHVGVGLEIVEMRRWWVALFVFEVVGNIAEEVEAFLG